MVEPTCSGSMIDQAKPDWKEPVPGFKYIEEEISVSPEFQYEKLRACGLEPSAFGTDADPAFFIGLAIQAGIRSGISAEGNINMLQGLTMHKRPVLGQELVISGEILSVSEVPRGLRVETDVSFLSTAGDRVISARRISLKPSQDAISTKSGAGKRPASLISDVKELSMGEIVELTPQAVKDYSVEGNSIHYEEEAAARAGFRAPIIGGGMGVHYLTHAIWSRKSPTFFDADIFFRRPIFWDEKLRIAVSNPELVAETKMAVVKDSQSDLKIGTEMVLKMIEWD